MSFPTQKYIHFSPASRPELGERKYDIVSRFWGTKKVMISDYKTKIAIFLVLFWNFFQSNVAINFAGSMTPLIDITLVY